MYSLVIYILRLIHMKCRSLEFQFDGSISFIKPWPIIINHI